MFSPGGSKLRLCRAASVGPARSCPPPRAAFQQLCPSRAGAGHKAEGSLSPPQAMSPDGEAIVTGAGDETLRFWNVFSKTRSTKVKWVGISARCSPTRVPSAYPEGSPVHKRPTSPIYPVGCSLPRSLLWDSHMPPLCSCIAVQPQARGTRRLGPCSPTHLGMLGKVPAGSPGPKPHMPSRQKFLPAPVLPGPDGLAARPMITGRSPGGLWAHRSLLCALQESVSVLNLFTRIR